MPKKMLTNVALVRAIARKMEEDMMLQLVVLTALGNYAEATLSHDEATPPDDWPKMISWPAWLNATKRLQAELDKQKG